MRDYVTLLKPGVMSLVVFTGAAGMWLAPGHLHPFLQILTVLAIAIGSGAGAAMNMWYDRDIDAVMTRTQNRPLPAGRVHPDDALAMGLLLSVASVGVLGLATNWLAAGILAFAIFFYAYVYTMLLKRSTQQNIVIGGAAGAFPPVIGWAAVSADPALMPWLLFAIIFLWTPPHFWALALYRHGDYAKAGVPMMPVVSGIAHTKKQIVFYSYLLVAATLAPALVHLTGAIYMATAITLGAGFLWHAHRVSRSDEPKIAMKMFGYSILYLFIIFAGFLIDNRITLPPLF